MIEPCYRYRASVNRVIDGDTYYLCIDVGFRAQVTLPIRLRGVDSPEVRGDQKAAGEAAKAAAEAFLGAASVIVVETYKDAQSFARWIADVYVDGESLADKMVAAGFAHPV